MALVKNTERGSRNTRPLCTCRLTNVPRIQIERLLAESEVGLFGVVGVWDGSLVGCFGGRPPGTARHPCILPFRPAPLQAAIPPPVLVLPRVGKMPSGAAGGRGWNGTACEITGKRALWAGLKILTILSKNSLRLLRLCGKIFFASFAPFVARIFQCPPWRGSMTFNVPTLRDLREFRVFFRPRRSAAPLRLRRIPVISHSFQKRFSFKSFVPLCFLRVGHPSPILTILQILSEKLSFQCLPWAFWIVHGPPSRLDSSFPCRPRFLPAFP